MEYAAGLTIVKTLGVDLTIQCLSSATSVVRLIGSIRTNDESKEITNYIEEEDLEKRIGVIMSVIKNINMDKHNTEPLSLCIGNLQECIKRLEDLLKAFNERVLYNRSIWVLSSLRSYGFSDLLAGLKVCTKNLESRKQELFNIIMINNMLLG